MSAIAHSSQESTVFSLSCTSIPRKQAGSPSRKNIFHANQHMSRERLSISLEASTDTLHSSTSKRFRLTRPLRGYTSRNLTPFPYQSSKYHSSEMLPPPTSGSKSSGLRFLDVGILAEAITKLTFRLLVGAFSSTSQNTLMV